MEISDWITLGAVVVALIIGVASVLHTQSLQKRERRERLLNEIIEWATDLANNLSELSVSGDAGIPDMKAPGAIKVSHDLLAKWTELLNISEYIKMITTKLEPNLGNTVNEISKELKYRIDLWTLSMVLYPTLDESEFVVLKDILDGKAKNIKDLSEVANNRLEIARNTATLRKSIRKLIKGATKLKIAG